MSHGIPDYTIVLAAGKGSRMGNESTPKVCFEINGVPAINRALEIYTKCGIPQHVVVVGTLAGKVVETVGGKFDHTVFVYQKEQSGTANALRCVYANLAALPDDADLLVVAGDRIIDSAILERLFDLYNTGGAKLAMLTLRCDRDSGQGRVICDRAGVPAAIIEKADIRQRKAYAILRELAASGAALPDRDGLRRMLCDTFFGPGKEPQPEKAVKAFGELWRRLDAGDDLTAAELSALIPEEATTFALPAAGGDLRLTPDEAAACENGNTSVYLLKSGILRSALNHLNRSNAQQEEYLSDLVGIYYRSCLERGEKPQIAYLRIEDRSKILGFNNPAELLEVEKQLSQNTRRETGTAPDPELFRPLSEWHRLLANGSFKIELAKIYGGDEDILARQTANLRELLTAVEKKFAPGDLIGIVRSPGRLNVLGRHIDHQGGNCNLMTIGFETVMAIHPRDDDRVTLSHCDESRFKGCEFSIGEMVSELPWEDWTSLVNSPKLAKMISEYGVDWSQYIKASVLRLQKKFSNRRLLGMDLVVGGNVPMAAGLSSSSSLVVGAAEAVVAVNRLDTFPAQIVNLCGEGEWFVGTRGGSADHAAVKMGRRGNVVKVRFFPFGVEEIVPFPENYSMVVCDSGIKARKSSDAKDQFNHRIACYRIGFKLLQKFLPQYRGVLHHLRDVNVRTLQVPLSYIYRLLLMLPESATRSELAAMLPGENLDIFFASHKEPADGLYPIRGVVLFGLSEFERAAIYTELLKGGRMDEIGRLMKISHDGDRVASFNAGWHESPYQSPVSNSYILEILADLESGAPDRVIRAQLANQPGAYACSLPEIDRMVDLACRTPGVAGAQLAGAGLGGCMMVLAETAAAPALIRQLEDHYYAPANKAPSILVCRPVAGSGLIRRHGN
ncbi:MAG: NTP transferase domain-containing protein [Victivallaceae bacterium]